MSERPKNEGSLFKRTWFWILLAAAIAGVLAAIFLPVVRH